MNLEKKSKCVTGEFCQAAHSYFFVELNASKIHNERESQRIEKELEHTSPIIVFRGLKVYLFSGENFPAALNAVGRLREEVFRMSGAGRGVEIDLDDLDFGEYAYKQLIAWDPGEKELVAVYRFQYGSRSKEAGDEYLRTSTLFEYSSEFRENMLPYAIELGRSVVNPSAKKSRFGFYALWKGLGVVFQLNPELKYFFGNVSLYKTMNTNALKLLVSYLETHYPPPVPLLKAKPNLRFHADAAVPEVVRTGETDTPAQRIKQLTRLMNEHGEEVPQILKSYMSLSNEIWFGETVIDRDFGDAWEIGLIVPFEHIDPKIKGTFSGG